MKTVIQKIEQYSLQKELSTEERRKAGRQTFLARDTNTQEPVVVKIIRLDQAIHTADQWVELKLFERESNILQTLDHLALPKYKDAFETDVEGIRSFVLVQSYLEADSLEALLQSGRRFSESEVLDIAKQLLTTLHYLHMQVPPVVHRDIKPSNILIGSSKEIRSSKDSADDHVGDVYLIDLGSIHTELTKESDTITIVGSYGYIPLEQFAGQAVPASDLYSLGMTLIYLVTGTHPADMAHINGKVQLPSHSVQPAFTRWLEKMTHPSLNQRIESAEQALAMLEAKEHNQGHYQHLKPEGTEIVVERTRDRLRISIDKPKSRLPRQAGNGVFALTYIVALFYFPVLLFNILPLTFALKIGIVVVSYVPVLRFIVMPLSLVLRAGVESSLSCYFRSRPNSNQQQTIVEIDRKQGIRTGTQRKDRTAVEWDQRTSRYEALDLLAYNPGYKFNSYKEGDNTVTQSKGGVPPELSVHAGTLSYPIGHSRLSAAEFWWLGQELSDFLDLELQTIYPMPIVTVAATSTGGCGC
ncbi:protein kinase domain [Synechococcus sp. PCC 7335]|uniref:serine/threonine protein kinase n=1 Tax=Synechococcus sp. (strain ATCC 29403 / PCC 7335) TaxID=91464 RepID=UPI00017EE001|nr:serine/threonine-protein kinase [Synechococcus sp. PCC 7335]EDX84003.1 protein kinase domain [Synechococcus sp. PCC 7335]